MKRKHTDQDETVGEFWRTGGLCPGGQEFETALRRGDPVLALMEQVQGPEHFLNKLVVYGGDSSANFELKSSSGVLDSSRDLRKE